MAVFLACFMPWPFLRLPLMGSAAWECLSGSLLHVKVLCARQTVHTVTTGAQQARPEQRWTYGSREAAIGLRAFIVVQVKFIVAVFTKASLGAWIIL